MIYSNRVTCPICDKEYLLHRMKPYKKRKYKVCKNCQQGTVSTRDGKEGHDCAACKFYNPVSEWWGKCELGKTAEEDIEEPMGLVYRLDVCGDFGEDL